MLKRRIYRLSDPNQGNGGDNPAPIVRTDLEREPRLLRTQ